jgi:hypothetical protein
MTDLGDISKQLAGFKALNLSALEPDFRMPEIRIPPNPNLASEFHSRLMKWISDFDASLDEAHEVGVRLVSFGQSLVFHLADMAYWNPSLISFQGSTDDGQPVELIQHVNQISILLMKLPRKDPSKPKRPIGLLGDSQESKPTE